MTITVQRAAKLSGLSKRTIVRKIAAAGRAAETSQENAA
jgi:hypothetical protein